MPRRKVTKAVEAELEPELPQLVNLAWMLAQASGETRELIEAQWKAQRETERRTAHQRWLRMTPAQRQRQEDQYQAAMRELLDRAEADQAELEQRLVAD